VRAVREDPKKKGLLYAGTERGVFVSFDDGAHWRSLQINLPITPVHDLVIKNDDLVAGDARTLVLDPRRCLAAAPVRRFQWLKKTSISTSPQPPTVCTPEKLRPVCLLRERIRPMAR
jgi:hypothetical protein